MNFENEELVVIYKKLKIEKEKRDVAIEKGFMLVTKMEKQDKNLQVGAKVRNIDERNADRIRESVIYKNYEKILTKLEPIVEIILDSDRDVQEKFKNL